MTSLLSREHAICPEEGVVLAQDLLCAFVLGLALAQAAGAHVAQDDRKPSMLAKRRMDNFPGRESLSSQSLGIFQLKIAR
jgi:hypothetical protein